MPAPRGQKRKSDKLTASTDDNVAPSESVTQTVATKSGDEIEASPAKKPRVGLTLDNKQRLIDNLQAEITERARKLRVSYNEHIRHLRFRVETRARRIPPSLLKTKMGDLLAKHAAAQQPKAAAPPPSAVRPPPVPPKDVIVGRPPSQRTAPGHASTASPVRMAKRLSEHISGGDKENEVAEIDNPKKKPRLNQATAATRPPPHPSQVLSPASSNSRILPARERAAAAPSPSRSFIARPVSPTKPATSSSGMFSSMVEKARSTRAAATTRKVTAASNAGSAAAPTAAASTRTRKGAAATAPASRAGATSRATRRVSAISESSEGSTGTVVRKRTAGAAAAAPAAKRTVMGTIRKGVTGTATKKAPAAKAAPAAASSTGRVLRKRN